MLKNNYEHKLKWAAPRCILHIDMDAYFAAIEQRDNPQLRGKPIAVGGAADSRGVISTASYEARPFGVHSAMASATARRLCPDLIILPPRFDVYKSVSKQIFASLTKYSEKIETVSLDEAYLDLTHNKLGLNDPVQLTLLIKQNIHALTQLTVSAGIGPNKFLAKIASDMRKPDGLFVVEPDQVRAFTGPLPVRKIPGIGPVTEKSLEKLGIKIISDLFLHSQAELTARFGKMGKFLYERARGIDERPVESAEHPSQIGCEETFAEDLTEWKDIQHQIRSLCEGLERRAAGHEARGRTITLKVKYHDFKVVTRQITLAYFVWKAEDFLPHVLSLCKNRTEVHTKSVRLLGLALSHLTFNQGAFPIDQSPSEGPAKTLWDLDFGI